MNPSDKATLIGAIGGLGLGGLAGYTASSRKRRFRNALLAALGGAVAGGVAGRLGNAHLDFVRRRNAARALPAGTKAVPGRVYYVSHPDNAIDVSETGLPAIDASAARLKRLTGWGGRLKIGHAGLVAVDRDGMATRYDYGVFDKGRAELLKNTFSVKGMSDDEIAKTIQKMTPHWGKTVDVHGTDVPDIGVAGRFMEGMMAPGRESFSAMPGGYSCGSAARNAFEAARGGVTGHLLDMLQGGFPSANAPTWGTNPARYTE